MRTFASRRFLARRALPGVVALAAFAACASSASAGFVSAQSNGHALSVNLSALVGIAQLNVGPVPHASGSAPVPYTQSVTLATLNASTLGVATIGTGLLRSEANSDVDGGAGVRTTSAHVVIDDLGVRVVPGALFVPDLINLSATTITSTSSVFGDGNTLSALGSSSLEDLTLSVAGVGNIIVGANPAPNTVVLNALGILIIANEQILGGDGITSRSMTTNALRISISTLGGNVVGGDIIIGHSHAHAIIPSPGAASLLCGALLVGTRRRRARMN